MRKKGKKAVAGGVEEASALVEAMISSNPKGSLGPSPCGGEMTCRPVTTAGHRGKGR